MEAYSSADLKLPSYAINCVRNTAYKPGIFKPIPFSHEFASQLIVLDTLLQFVTAV